MSYTLLVDYGAGKWRSPETKTSVIIIALFWESESPLLLPYGFVRTKNFYQICSDFVCTGF